MAWDEGLWSWQSGWWQVGWSACRSKRLMLPIQEAFAASVIGSELARASAPPAIAPRQILWPLWIGLGAGQPGQQGAPQAGRCQCSSACSLPGFQAVHGTDFAHIYRPANPSRRCYQKAKSHGAADQVLRVHPLHLTSAGGMIPPSFCGWCRSSHAGRPANRAPMTPPPTTASSTMPAIFLSSFSTFSTVTS